jgi:hypothetical protein
MDRERWRCGRREVTTTGKRPLSGPR